MQGCVHRALFCLTLRVQGEHTEGKERMIFRAYASKNPGVWGWPQGALLAQTRNNGNRKFTIFAIQLLLRIKTVAAPTSQVKFDPNGFKQALLLMDQETHDKLHALIGIWPLMNSRVRGVRQAGAPLLVKPYVRISRIRLSLRTSVNGVRKEAS